MSWKLRFRGTDAGRTETEFRRQTVPNQEFGNQRTCRSRVGVVPSARPSCHAPWHNAPFSDRSGARAYGGRPPSCRRAALGEVAPSGCYGPRTTDYGLYRGFVALPPPPHTPVRIGTARKYKEPMPLRPPRRYGRASWVPGSDSTCQRQPRLHRGPRRGSRRLRPRHPQSVAHAIWTDCLRAVMGLGQVPLAVHDMAAVNQPG